MTGYIITTMNDVTCSNSLEKSLDRVKEDILNRKIDKFFMKDILDGYYVSDMNNIKIEDDFEEAIEQYINVSEWIITVNVDTKSIETYEFGNPV